MRRAAAPFIALATLLIAATACGSDESPKSSTDTEATSEQNEASNESDGATPTGALSGADAIDAAMDAGIFASRPDDAMIETATVSESGATVTAATESFEEFYAAIGYVDGTDFMGGRQHPNGRCGAASGGKVSEGVFTMIIQCKPSGGATNTTTTAAAQSGAGEASWPASVPLPEGASVTSAIRGEYQIAFSGTGIYEAFNSWGAEIGSVTQAAGDDGAGRIIIEAADPGIIGLRPGGSGPVTVDVMIGDETSATILVY